MCGISGVLASCEPPRRRRERVQVMTHQLRHRGPDEEGFWEDRDIALGFRRLAVIDLVTGSQPIVMPETGAVIVLNGEIYNFRELRAELEPRHAFRTRGDVEVVLRLLVEQGAGAIRRLGGMFAFALWDPRRQSLLLARDRFGIKPLYLYQRDGTLAFASELRALLAGGFPPERRLDLLAVRQLLDQKYVRPDRCIVEGITCLPPASALEVTPKGVRAWRYWEPPAPLQPGPAVVSDLRERLREAVQRHMVADVPVGVFLSGGVDSSLVAAIAQQAAGRPLEAFTVSFAGNPPLDEAPVARQVAARIGCHHHVLTVDPREVAHQLPEIASALDTPMGDATAIPTWYVSRLARAHVTVTLSGEGADELFGGYARQRFDVLLDRLGRAGRWVLPKLAAIAGRPLSARARQRLDQPPGLARQLDWSCLFSPAEVDKLTAVPLPAADAETAESLALAQRWREHATTDALNARLLCDLDLFLPGDLLPKVDRMSMAHGLEVRVPYLDAELAEHVLALPGHVKLDLVRDKRLLREVATGWLPGEFTRRRKHGFDVPIGDWLRGALRETLQDTLGERTVCARGLLSAPAVNQMVKDHLHGHSEHGEQLWCLLVTELWLQEVFDRPAEVAP